MFDRLQKPFLTVETGEAYQPVRLTYEIRQKDALLQALEKLQCLEKNLAGNSWNWCWKAECNDLHFESLSSFRRNPNPDYSMRLGTLSLRDNKFYINLPSFKRACLAVPFFHRRVGDSLIHLIYADFINKVFSVDERLPHGFTELLKEEDLEKVLRQRVDDYHKVKEEVEQAPTAEQAFSLLSEYTEKEGKKRLPYAERYLFNLTGQEDSDMVFLSFYIYLRSRELVAIKRWFGHSNYTLADTTDDMIEQVFGGLDIDIS